MIKFIALNTVILFSSGDHTKLLLVNDENKLNIRYSIREKILFSYYNSMLYTNII